MIISKLTQKSKGRNIDSFSELVGNNIKIIVRGDYFVEDFFRHSESSLIAGVRGKKGNTRRYFHGKPHPKDFQ